MEQWKQTAERLLFIENKTWGEIDLIMAAYFPELNAKQVHEKVRGYLRGRPQYIEKNPRPSKPADIFEMLKKGATISEITERANLTEKQAKGALSEIELQGYVVKNVCGTLQISNTVTDDEPNRIQRDWNGDKIIRFGLVGDTQINSKYTQITLLHKLYDFYQKDGIKTVYHTGDIDEGEEMRPGHKYECYEQGADDHVNEIVRVYPERTGTETEFISGNHDHSFIKRAGLDIGIKIAEKRKDMIYLGQSSAIIELTPNCTLELRHPIDGTAYAISYKTQKMIEAMSGGEKPNILAIGHYHKMEYLFYRNIHAFQTGTLQAQTSWMKGKQISAHLGGWIIEAHVNDDGSISRLKQEFIPFYTAIKDDYKNWR